jgi:2-methylcitrate dehydratase
MTMAPIQASIDVIQKNKINPSDIKSAVIRFPHYALNKPSWDPKKFDPRNRETADHSFMYCTAVAMLDGECGPNQFTAEKLASPVVRQLMAATTLIADPELTKLWPYSAGGAAEVTLKSGKKYESVCEYPPGHPENRCSDEVVEGKFRRLSKGLLTDAQQQRIIDAIWAIDECGNVSDFMRLLTV